VREAIHNAVTVPKEAMKVIAEMEETATVHYKAYKQEGEEPHVLEGYLEGLSDLASELRINTTTLGELRTHRVEAAELIKSFADTSQYDRGISTVRNLDKTKRVPNLKELAEILRTSPISDVQTVVVEWFQTKIWDIDPIVGMNATEPAAGEGTATEAAAKPDVGPAAEPAGDPNADLDAQGSSGDTIGEMSSDPFGVE